MDLVMGTLGKLPSKLLELLKDEYKLQTGVKDRIRSGARELESMHAVLRKVAQVPLHELDELVLLWAHDVREASYDMEDILDTFLVRVNGGTDKEPADAAKVKQLLKKISSIFSLSKGKARHKIAGAIDALSKQLEDVAKLRDRYTVDDIVQKSSATTSIDPRLSALYTKVTQLVGIDEPMNKLIQMLTIGDDDDVPNKETRIVSVVGSGGLGKTTLVKAVYDKLNLNIPVKAFVPVGQKPDLKKVFRDILMALEKDAGYVMRSNFTILDERQLIDELRDFLKDRRYVIHHILFYFYALHIKLEKF
jgi:Ni2+-binding GTPase involved in maturation of urease and hydrogenase